jgi:K+-sensing histidine kinase KdpD
LPKHPGEPIPPEECAEQVSAMASEFLREVRTPFASIEGAAFILGENSTTPDRRSEFLAIIMTECKRVDAILSELDASTEIVPLACCPTDASSMLGEVIRLAAMEDPDPAISLRIEVAPDLPQVWCEPIRIKQTIIPFVTGAMLSMPGGGEILLAADRQTGHARIQLGVLGQMVRDSDPAAGRGAYSSTFDAPGGMGVLAARRTVLQHGGTITLDQTGPLKKLISLTLPLYHGQEP